MWALVRRVQLLDRRVVYLLLVFVLSIPFAVPFGLPIRPDTYTQRFFDKIEQIARAQDERRQRGEPEQVVLFLTNWGPGQAGESEPQFRILARHLLRRRLKTVFLCSMGDPVFHDAALAALRQAQRDEQARATRRGEPRPEWTYGEDYLDFGYVNAPTFASQARAIITQPRDTFGRDFVGRRDLQDDSSYPLLQRLHGVDDVAAVVVVSGGDEGKYIASLVRSDFPQLQVGQAAAGIAASDLYPYVRSGQLFGLLNSARSAAEYRVLLNPDEPATTAVENAMSLGKSLLLLLVLVGNVAFVTTRWAERSGRLAPDDGQARRSALPPLSSKLLWLLFIALVVLFAGTAAVEMARTARTQALPRPRVAGPDVGSVAGAGRFERVSRDQLLAEVQDEAAAAHDRLLARVAQVEAQRRWMRLVETRVGEYLMAFLTLGVFAFLLGDNRFYRFIEAIIVGGALAYMLDAVDKILRPQWAAPIWAALTGASDWTGALWLLLLVPGALWYVGYWRKTRWLNQLIVAGFIGLTIGPEFKNQINLLIPQVLDTIRPVWPWVTTLRDPRDPASAGTSFSAARLEHLVFVVVAVLSLLYFVLCFRPRGAVGRATLSAGRIVLMVGFGVVFGNTVNTRFSWLAPRIGFLIDDWLGKLIGG